MTLMLQSVFLMRPIVSRAKIDYTLHIVNTLQGWKLGYLNL